MVGGHLLTSLHRTDQVTIALKTLFAPLEKFTLVMPRNKWFASYYYYLLLLKLSC